MERKCRMKWKPLFKVGGSGASHCGGIETGQAEKLSRTLNINAR